MEKKLSLSGTSYDSSASVKGKSVDTLIFFTTIATVAELAKCTATVTLKSMIGRDEVLGNSLPLDLIARMSNFKAGYDLPEEVTGGLSAFHLPLGNIILSGDDELILSVKTTENLIASKVTKVFISDTIAGVEQILKYDYIPAASGVNHMAKNCRELYLYSDGEESSENEITVTDSFGTEVVPCLGVVTQGAVLGRSETWIDFGVAWRNRFGLPDNINFTSATSQEFLAVCEVFQKDRKIRNQAPRQDYAKMVQVIKTNPEMYNILHSQGRI